MLLTDADKKDNLLGGDVGAETGDGCMSPNNLVGDIIANSHSDPPANILSGCLVFLCNKMAITLVANHHYCIHI